MNIGIYNEPAAGVGGSEFCAAALADHLSSRHAVTIVHHKKCLSKQRLAEFFSVPLENVALQYHPPAHFQCASPRLVWTKESELRRWKAEISSPFDAFIAIVHDVPPYCHSPLGILYVLFPFFDRWQMWPWSEGRKPWRLHSRMRQWLYEWEWKRRLASYQVKCAISEYSARWTQRRWGVECQVIHPPSETEVTAGPKRPCILSVGRFTPAKKQWDLLCAFRDAAQASLRGWEYVLVGGLGQRPEEQEYFRKLEGLARTCGAKLLPNADHETLRGWLRQASLFWHGMGYGEDPDAKPEAMEHYGITTVEAMAAGCVPVVINRGGQPEIVQTGISGFTWDTLAELVAYTSRLAQDGGLRDRMAQAARQRAQELSRQQFVQRFLSLLPSDA